jgi:hypothetical protein
MFNIAKIVAARVKVSSKQVRERRNERRRKRERLRCRGQRFHRAVAESGKSTLVSKK